MAWIYLNVNPVGRITGDCVVRAISYLIGQSWDRTFNDLCDFGFDRKEMPSWNPVWWAYLKARGYRRYVIPDTCPDCKYSVSDFCRDFPKGKYLLFIPHTREDVGHAVAVEDGNVFDTWNCLEEQPLVYWRKE